MIDGLVKMSCVYFQTILCSEYIRFYPIPQAIQTSMDSPSWDSGISISNQIANQDRFNYLYHRPLRYSVWIIRKLVQVPDFLSFFALLHGVRGSMMCVVLQFPLKPWKHLSHWLFRVWLDIWFNNLNFSIPAFTLLCVFVGLNHVFIRYDNIPQIPMWFHDTYLPYVRI